MSSSKKVRSRGGRRKQEIIQDVNVTWTRLLECFSAASEPELKPEAALVQLAELPLQNLTRPFKEIESDILLIGGHLSLFSLVCSGGHENLNESDETAHKGMCCAFCRILTKLLSHSEACLTVTAFRDLIRLILQWTEQSLEAPQVTQVAIDSVAALGAILSAFQAQISVQMQVTLQQVLTTALTKYRCAAPPSNIYSRDSGKFASSVELCHVASDALHSLFLSRQDVQPGLIEETMRIVINFLQRQKPAEHPFLSRMYESLLKMLTTLVVEGKGVHASHVALLVEAITSFLAYGLQSPHHSFSVSDTHSDASSDGSGGKYLPPQRRTADRSGYSSTGSSTFSGSETSGGGIRSSDQGRTARVRLAAINLIQKMSQVDSRSLHQYWCTLFPVRQPLQRSPSAPHLITILLYDPHPQARMAAAGTIAVLLEGRAQKTFLSVAKLSDRDSSAIRGFTTLSLSLGRMLVALHDGLLHAIENEEKLSVIPHLFRTLNTLISSTPYDRMPSDLRTRITRSVRKQWIIYHGQGDGDVSRETACMIALRAVLGSVPPEPLLGQYLEELSLSDVQSTLSRTVHEFLSQDDPGWSLLDALLSVSYLHRDVVRSEALAALTCAASSYSHLFKERWRDVSRLLDKNIKHGPLEHSGPEEKAYQQAVRLFGALIADSVLKENEQFLKHAAEAVMTHIVPSLVHSSPVIRAAALTEIGGATRELLAYIPESVLQTLLNGALQAALEDPVAAVRSSACRMIGDLVNIDFYLSEKATFDQMIVALSSCQESRTISVRISSSWSLANVADAIARHRDALPHIPKDAMSLKPLAVAAIAASRDHEKVRANGIRALGHLLRETQFSDDQVSIEWLGDAIACLQSSLEEGSAKVKWNACYATGSLASNLGLRDALSTSGTLTTLVALLVHLVNENPNFKVQMQAAAALDSVSERQLFRDTFFPAISAVGRRLHILQDRSQESYLEENADSELIQPTVNESFPNFKYHEGLKKQLEITLMHLLSLLDGPFSDSCIFPRPPVLFAWLKKKVAEALEVRSDAQEPSELRARLRGALQGLREHETNLFNWDDLWTAIHG